jgi:hypothetical protein
MGYVWRPRGAEEIDGLIAMKRVFYFVPVVLLLLIFQPFAAAEAGETRRVLVLSSEDRDNPGQEMVEQGIRAGFRSKKDFETQLYTEYLDAYYTRRSPCITSAFPSYCY